jgi:hypothetical protein
MRLFGAVQLRETRKNRRHPRLLRDDSAMVPQVFRDKDSELFEISPACWTQVRAKDIFLGGSTKKSTTRPKLVVHGRNADSHIRGFRDCSAMIPRFIGEQRTSNP